MISLFYLSFKLIEDIDLERPVKDAFLDKVWVS
jgi:hypothetical protein